MLVPGRVGRWRFFGWLTSCPLFWDADSSSVLVYASPEPSRGEDISAHGYLKHRAPLLGAELGNQSQSITLPAPHFSRSFGILTAPVMVLTSSRSAQPQQA